MTVFNGYTHDENDPERWANVLLIENAEDVAADHTTSIPVVRVETNYKPSAELGRPVHLTLADALKAATYMVTHTQNSMEEFDASDLLGAVDDDHLVQMQAELLNLDSAVWELRTLLHGEMSARREPQIQDAGQSNGATLPAGPALVLGEVGMNLGQLDVAFLPHAIAAVKRVERKQMPHNGEPMPWWPLEVDQVQAAYVVSLLNHPLQVIAAHAETLEAHMPDLPERRGNLTEVVGNLRERVSVLRKYTSELAGQPSTAEDLEGLRSLAEFVQSGVCVLASALPSSVTITDTPTDNQKGQN